MATPITYDKIQELREIMLDELGVPVLTVEQMRLVEARIQTLIFCECTDVKKIKKVIKDKRDASNK